MTAMALSVCVPTAHLTTNRSAVELSIERDITEAVEAINAAQSFLLTCHIHPDGDALGSTLAMAHGLISKGKKVVATFPDPFVVPESLVKTLPGTELLRESSEVLRAGEHFDVAMTFDCGSRTRLTGLEPLLDSADVFINVDHHLSNERFGTINVISVEAASSGSVVLKIFDACGIALTKESAQCMYVALLTDTGRFQFSSTTPDVFEQAKRLSQFDLPIAEMSRSLTEEDSFAFLTLAGEALSVMERDEESNVVSATVTIDMQQAHGVSYDETEALIEYVRRAKECDVACVVKEYLPGDYRVSLRSLGIIDVCQVAQARGGGGHRYAAGFSSTQSPQEIIQSVRDDVVTQRAKIAQ